jgi:hypothetical protein
LGTSLEQTQEWYPQEEDMRTLYQGVPAQIGASHWQFVSRKSTLQEFLPFMMDRPMGQVRMLDQRMNEAGYLRLMVSDPLAQNMSNTLPIELRPSLQKAPSAQPGSLAKKIAAFPLVRKFLMGWYDRIFRLYN